MKRPSRGERESVTTTRYAGRLVVPVRLSRIVTGTCSPPSYARLGRRDTQPRDVLRLALPWKSRKILHAGKFPLHALELLHDLAELRVLLEQPVHVLHVGAAAARAALSPAAVDDLGIVPLARRHRADDRVEPIEVGRFAVEVLGGALEHLAEGEHTEDLIERAHLAQLLELIAEVFEREGVLAKLLGQRLGLGLIDGRLCLLD